MIKTASILNSRFEARWLAALCGDKSAREQAPDLLNNLADMGMLVAEDGHYYFADPLLRETAYETMLFAQRR